MKAMKELNKQQNQFIDYLKAFLRGLNFATDVVMAEIALAISILSFLFIPKSSGYEACLMFVLGILATIYFVLQIIRIGNCYISKSREDK